jgi:CRP/FNR family transcriptional regulator, cyclic AMP receptor protein
MNVMATHRRAFSPKIFLSTVGVGREMMSFRKGQIIYAQCDGADSLFVIQTGMVKLSIKSQTGKETTTDVMSVHDFVGKDSIAGQSSRTASATAMTECTLLRITKKAMMLALKRHVKLASIFLAYVLARNIRYQQDLVEQHCSTSEKRLARILLLLAHYDRHGRPEKTVSKISHETLAEMVGTTRSRVCFFMNNFKKSGFISYQPHGRVLRVHRALFAFRGA